MVFLDVEPRRLQHHPQRNRNSSGGGFFSAQRPIDSPRTYSNRYSREPLKALSASQNNAQTIPPPSHPEKTTVRIIERSPKVLGKDRIDDENKSENGELEHDLSRIPLSAEKVGPDDVPSFQQGSHASEQDRSVSQLDSRSSEAQPSGDVSTTHASSTAPWHRRTGSNLSTSSTLKDGDTSFGGQSVSNRSRLSQGTTLRGGTPILYEDEDVRAGPQEALQTLEEASPERTTVRAVPASLKSESSDRQLQSEAIQQSSPIVRRETSYSSDSGLQTESPATRNSRRTSSTGSLPTAANLRDISVIHYPQTQRSQDSLAQSEVSLPAPSSPNFAVFASEQSIPPSSIPPSSPNFIAYHSDSSRPRSRSHPLHGATSHESIASRLQPYSRPQTGSAASPGASSSTDTLPPLQLPKKRLRHKPAALSLDSSSNKRSFATDNEMVTEEELDTLPYPRYQYSNPLSTIMSESDRYSRTSSVPLSHFSLGSGVLTIDDSSSNPISGNWSARRRGSAPIESIVSSSPALGISNEESQEAGDMTLGLFREESAKPQPLFKPSASAPGQEDRKYDGPLPPIPPIPPSRDSDENFDTVSELQSPPLREQRSGYSLRARSNSTPSRSQSRRSNSHSRHLSQASYNESDRGSHGSSIFPIWAKQFYKHNVPLMSASKVSLSGPPMRPGQSHLRNDSQWTERSITSRLGTGYSEIEGTSPRSSHFLPSIFRPRTRDKSNTGGKKLQKDKGRASQDETSRSDSMAIHTDPLPQGAETTASGQPKYGELKDSHEQRRPLPRKYSKQKQWNDMTFPRPMTKDRLSDFGSMHISEPHLGPSKRISNRLSIWRAPSFVESLDSLVRSRTNRQILLFALGFVVPFCWMIAAVLPIPKRPITADQLEKSLGGSEDDVAAVMMKHEAGDAEKRWKDEKMFLKARWWRSLNRIMSVVGLLVIGAVVALAVVATTRD